jgi:hypothetical protein
MPTTGAGLASRFPLPNLYDLLISHAGNMLQNEHELGETQVADLPPPQLLHAAQVEGFKPQRVVLVTQGMCEFEVRVTPLVRHPLMRQGELTLRRLPVARPFLLARQLAVETGYFRQVGFQELR